MTLSLSRARRAAAALALLATAAACERGELTAVEPPATGQLTVDASAGWAYVDLAAGAVVPQTAAAASTTWDIGFNATNVVLNGGPNGPAGVTALCLCQNGGATNEQVLAMTLDGEAPDFAAVTETSIPATTAAWSADAFTASRWYRYNILGDHRVSPTFDVYLVRRGAAVYKLQVINYYGPAGETRRITFRYAKLRG